jgi:5-methylcytosine-specific restriction endonuclease McrBC regulatory subunit McrC
VGVGSIEELRKLVEEKMEKVRKLGDEAWKKGLEQAKPYLDKNPKIKEIVESNASALKSGNVTELFQQVKEAASSGNTDKLQDYVKQAGEKAKNSGMGQSTEQYAKMIPGGSEILPKLQKLQEVARKKGDDAERILKGAYEDVQEVLQKRIKEAEKLADEAGKEAKN